MTFHRPATMALAPLSLRQTLSTSRFALRATSIRSLSSSSPSTAWLQRGGYGCQSRAVPTAPFIRTQAFSVSARLRKDAEKGAAPALDAQFKQYKFEDITSTLPSTTSTSPPSTPVLIDVREPAELVATGIIPTAINLPLGSAPDALSLPEDEFLSRFGAPKPAVGSELVFYCRAGVRAKTAAQRAVQAGYDAKKIGIYDGSWLDWEKQGGKVEKWEG